MTNSSRTFRAGTRSSRLALLQTRFALAALERRAPAARFEAVPLTTPGDRDLATDLRASPQDFFTRDLDDAVLGGALDCAVHSAKDLPDPLPEGLDWVWLPWREDPRDALVLPAGRTWADLPARPVAGISSDRRAAYCRRRFPGCEPRPVRGTIEQRLDQLDAGRFDFLLMAGAALVRLGLASRATEWVPLEELPTPEGQGALALTFRSGDPAFLRLRSLAVKAVTFVGAGAGRGACTLAGAEALARAEICLHDTLLDTGALELLPSRARRVDVGKRAGCHRADQAEINRLLTVYARQGLRVVRLKGGDPGVFGRLAEEVEALEALRLPYRVLPGVSSLQAATTGTGLLLTRRGVSRGFCVITPRAQGGALAPVGAGARAALPIVSFMGVEAAPSTARELLADGLPADTPAALVFDAGGEREAVERARLDAFAGEGPDGAALPPRLQAHAGAPALFIVGEVTRHGYARDHGALRGRRVLLTCSAALQDKAAALVLDWGGRPVRRPLIRAVPEPAARDALARLDRYAWLVVTSPSAVRGLAALLREAGADLRRLPRVMVTGPGTAAALEQELGVRADLQPAADFGAAGIVEAVAPLLESGRPVLRLRSDKAGGALAAALRARGIEADDLVLYRNEPVAHAERPEFDDVFFASASAVEAFASLWGVVALEGRTVAAIGAPTAAALQRLGRQADVLGYEATVEGALDALAAHAVNAALATKEEA